VTDSATLITVAVIAASPGLIGIFMTAKQNGKIHQIHQDTNSMKDALVKATGELMYARGVKDESERKTPPGNAS
jgi:hypothetical protein